MLDQEQSAPNQPGLWFLNRGLFSEHFLKARLPRWKDWQTDDGLVEFRQRLASLYESTRAVLLLANEAQTEKEFVQPVLDLLGYADSYIVQAPTQIGEHTNRPDYALFPDQTTKNRAYEKLKDNDYTLCIGIADAKYWQRELDLARASDRETLTNQNPSVQIARYLTGTKQNWGILTNGRHWRLYSSKSHVPLGNYYQINLVELLEEAPTESLKYFYVLFRKQAFLRVEGKSLLDRILEESEQYAVELEADIKERAYQVVELLCRGFTADLGREELTDATLRQVYDNSLILLYRLLFVFYAEARELLPLAGNPSYRETYSLRKLTHDIDETLSKGYELSTGSTRYYDSISSLFHLINKGDPKLGVPHYNGGLFDPTEHPFLERHAISDAYFVQAIHQLARVTDRKLKREVAVDYNTLSERHLGSIYEGLLEFKPRTAPHDLVIIKDKGTARYAAASEHPDKQVACTGAEVYLANDKGERKASGSYYTPEYIVNYIVENTMDPLVEEAHLRVRELKPGVDRAIAEWQRLREQKQGREPIEKYDRTIAEERDRLLEPYLALKVLDPAMGSGHFLSRATEFIAEAIATDPDIESPVGLAEESEIIYYRRRVVESCIYGVDLNPLAVELAKLTLWLTTMAKAKPLSFLNHHLRVGNSLIGASVSELDEIAQPKRKSKAIDLSRAPVQLGMFQQLFNKGLYDLLQNRALIARFPTETLEDVRNKEKWEMDFEHKMRRFRTLADLWVSTYFGNSVAWDEYNMLVENLQSSESEWEESLEGESVQRAKAIAEAKHFLHWELEFPEVFFDRDGTRLANPGFSAVSGNPPYGDILSDTEKEFLQATGYSSGGSGNNDVYRFFCEHGLKLLRVSGYLGFIIPNTCLGGPKYKSYRKCISQLGQVQEIFDFRTYRQFDQNVFTQIVLIKRNCATTPYRFMYKLPIDGSLSDYDARPSSVTPGSDKSWYPKDSIMQRVIADPRFAELRALCESKDVGINYQRHGVGWQHRQKSKIAQSIFYEGSREDERDLAYIKGEDIGRFVVAPVADRWLRHDYLQRVSGNESVSVNSEWANLCPKIVSRQTADSVVAAIDLDRFHTGRSLHTTIVTDANYSYGYVIALLNSGLVTHLYRSLSHEVGRAQAQVNLDDVRQLPIRCISFTTPKPQRARLVAEARNLYGQYLLSKNWDRILSFVGQRLPQHPDGTPDTTHEQSDVVHDLLSALVEEMTRLHRDRQAEIMGFLGWLECYLGVKVEYLKSKTKVSEYYKAEVAWEGFLSALQQSRRPIQLAKGVDISRREPQATIRSERDPSVAKLTPMLEAIELTDKLIDQIVYKLYGLTKEEVTVVEGRA